ncbi:MAG: hypothetical protein ACU0AT_04660 [Tranquillimonas sp.]
MTADPTAHALLARELALHPLGAQVLDLARERGIDAGDLAGMARLIAELDGSRAAQGAPLILVLSRLLERIAAAGAPNER